MVNMVNFLLCVFYHKKNQKEKRGKKHEHDQGGSRGVSTSFNEVLENPRELRVFIDVEKVREGLHHLLLLEEKQREGFLTRQGSTAQTATFLPLHCSSEPFVCASRQLTP